MNSRGGEHSLIYIIPSLIITLLAITSQIKSKISNALI